MTVQERAGGTTIESARSVPAIAGPPAIHAAGIYNIPESDYRADQSLSHSGARRLLESPAKYAYWSTREQHANHFDFGKAAHSLVLGTGAQVVVVDAADWRTKAAQQARDDARAAGHTPVLAHDWAVVEAMAEQLRAHPIAPILFTDGTPEQSLFWQRGGVPCRARLDWCPNPPATRRAIIPDYKTTVDASTGAFARSAASYGYHQQADWYVDGYTTLTGVDAAFVFVAQEKDPPFLVNVIELDDLALEIGRARNQRALDLYRECDATGVWPGYPAEVQQVGLPRWAQLEHEQQLEQEVTSSW